MREKLVSFRDSRPVAQFYFFQTPLLHRCGASRAASWAAGRAAQRWSRQFFRSSETVTAGAA